MRFVPVPKHGVLVAQYVEPPAATAAFDTAYLSKLPHDRSKLCQLDLIEEMLLETVQSGCCCVSGLSRSHGLNTCQGYMNAREIRVGQVGLI